jgi:cytoskeletal protein CcmA (bactofilin family)
VCSSDLIFGTGSYSTISVNAFSGSANGKIGINVPLPIYSLDVSGSGNFTNNLTATGSIYLPSLTNTSQPHFVAYNSSSGQLYYLGTGSFTAATASYVTSSNVYGPYGSNSILSASYALSASQAQNAVSASYVLNAISASYAATASSADNFLVRGTLTAQTIIAQVITSSTDFVTGSTRFGTQLTNTHQFTGSVSITGSLTVVGAGITGSLFGTASWAVSASQALTASYVLNAISSSYALSASQAQNAVTASYVLNAVSASFASTASFVQNAVSASFASTASYVLNAVSASFASTASFVQNAISASFASTTSLAQNALTASYITASGVFGPFGSNSVISSSFALTASFVQNAISASYALSASNAQTASYVLNAVSASFASTASFVQNAVSASFASTASLARNALTASFVTASNVFGPFGSNSVISSSFASTASFVQNAVSASFAATASSADNFTVRGTLTAQTIITQVITSSTDFVTGSSRFGTLLSNTHQFTGSVTITGSLNVTGAGITGSLFGTSSWAVSASQALTASYILNAVSASFASTASFVQNAVSASFASTASFVQNAVSASFSSTASFVRNAVSASFAATASYITASGVFGPFGSNSVISASHAVTSAFAANSSGVSGGAANYITMWTSATALSSSAIYQSIGNIGIGTIIPNAKLDVNGNTIITGSLTVAPSNNIELQVQTTGVKIGNVITDTHTITGSVNVSGSVTATNFTGSLFGTASWAVSASQALTSSYVLNAVSASFASTASFVRNAVSASFANTASFVQNAVSASFASTASYVLNAVSASFASTASFVQNAVSASFAATASSADNFTVRNTLTAQTIVVQTITSSIDFVTGSSRFGTLLSNTHQFTGSVSMTGSLTVVGAGITGSLFGTSSWAVSASQALTASYVLNAVSSSFASTASFVQNAVSASFANTASYVLNAVSSSFASTASFVQNAVSASFALSSSRAVSASFALTASYITASGVFGPFGSNSVISASHAVTAAFAANSSGVSGGAANYITMWTSATALSSSVMYQLNGNIGIRRTNPDRALDVSGSIRLDKGDLTIASDIAPGENGFGVISATGSLTNTSINIQGYYGASTVGSTTVLLNPQGGKVGINTGTPRVNTSLSASLHVDGGVWANNYTSSITNAVGFFGTASWAVSASRAVTASYVLNAVSSSFASTASFVQNAVSASFASTASYVLNAISASFALSSSRAVSASFALTSSYITASGVFGPFGSNSVISASHAVSASRAITASYASNANLSGGTTDYIPIWTSNTTLGISQIYQTQSAFTNTAGNYDISHYIASSADGSAAIVFRGTDYVIGGNTQINHTSLGISSFVNYGFASYTGSGFYGSGSLDLDSVKLSFLDTDKFEFSSSGMFRAADDIVSFYSFSDRNLKYDVRQVCGSVALDQVQQLQGVYYKWIGNQGSRANREEIGLIAQDVEKVIPQLVREQERLGQGTFKTVDYNHLTALLIEAIKEQQKQIDELKQKIK